MPASDETKATKPAKATAKSAEVDDQIGRDVPDDVEFLSYADGREYKCADGKITERVK